MLKSNSFPSLGKVLIFIVNNTHDNLIIIQYDGTLGQARKSLSFGWT